MASYYYTPNPMNYTDRNQMGYSDSTEQDYNQRQSAGKPFIYIRNIEKTYFTGDLPYLALKDISLTIDDGKITVILGPSGSGKSTLMNILGGIDYCDNGVINVDSEDISMMNSAQLTNYRMKKVGFVFQFYNLIPNLTVYENVEVAANLTGNPNENKILKRRRNYREIMNALEAVDMWQMKDRFPKELSGGQQQRVSIARAIVKKPRMLLCDEPTGALDVEMSIQVMKVLKRLNAEQRTNVIIITHNPVIAEMAHKVITIKNGTIAEERINENPKSVEMIEW
ncbi:putative ABC transport system ATP-binding protein [Ruminococcus flavefaciens]|uniref:Putative ABC transport system ATP-binding protein n=2 Tax=Ruminococcus flavefaciens TaxID=1265 RepID=A0A315XZ44_RUMFL|nr:putative ABC transport system ATP-binding protein [Ruminococcus flavefaciens]SSA48568.1 putative ABC transport system ATP-binding protein [Ruminococcus flavefaciens]